MPFTATVHRVFSAAHAVRMPDGVLEPLHGHNWEVRVTVAREALDDTGFVVDFHALEASLDEVLRPLHNRNLNEVAELGGLNPTAEHVVLHIVRRLKVPDGATLDRVEVSEAPGCVAAFRAR
jgi:6-pyruvoyltetrahydropterin/6-carboxytetrahydropterin synthase